MLSCACTMRSKDATPNRVGRSPRTPPQGSSRSCPSSRARPRAPWPRRAAPHRRRLVPRPASGAAGRTSFHNGVRATRTTCMPQSLICYWKCPATKFLSPSSSTRPKFHCVTWIAGLGVAVQAARARHGGPELQRLLAPPEAEALLAAQLQLLAELEPGEKDVTTCWETVPSGRCLKETHAITLLM